MASSSSKPGKSSSALALCVAFGAALLAVPLLPQLFPNMPDPTVPGLMLTIVAVVASFFGLYMDHILSSESEGIERYTLEVCLAAAGALVSLAIAQDYPTQTQFTAGQGLMRDLGIATSSPRQAAWVLAIISVIMVVIAFLIAALLKKRHPNWIKILLRSVSVSALLAAYALFLLTILYAA